MERPLVRLTLRVHPRASRNAVRMGSGAILEVWTTRPAAEQEANEAACALVAAQLGLARSDVRIVAGLRSRTKVVEIAGETSEGLQLRLAFLEQ